ncbi:hypothetical protein WR25_17360 [Diploscapter pachys]|uniref:Uncharacterized protein n=1 Tax=Diploscapter pachys TaxID=2018661 RepID=A0A2A2KTI6_9BILA|nr:hypothetical protein WR25_17360 [Diploscapter pachys]
MYLTGSSLAEDQAQAPISNYFGKRGGARAFLTDKRGGARSFHQNYDGFDVERRGGGRVWGYGPASNTDLAAALAMGGSQPQKRGGGRNIPERENSQERLR